jgi:hypothetical protein
LEHRCLKWVRMTHLDTWNTSYGQKKGQESNWQFDSRPLKVRNLPNFLACKWRATYHWKTVDEVYNFALDLISIRGLYTKLWAPQRRKSPNFRNFKTSHLGVSGQKAIWMLVPWPATKYTIRGEGGGFPQVRAMVSLVSLSLLVVHSSTKSVLALH